MEDILLHNAVARVVPMTMRESAKIIIKRINGQSFGWILDEDEEPRAQTEFEFAAFANDAEWTNGWRALHSPHSMCS
jgi:hypothetical protein